MTRFASDMSNGREVSWGAGYVVTKGCAQGDVAALLEGF